MINKITFFMEFSLMAILYLNVLPY
jgi:hypothetical protein